MKINPAAIQTYQQVINRQPGRSADSQKEAQAAGQQPVTITPQRVQDGSSVAVAAPTGTYAGYLSDAEKAALDLLFERFGDSSRFGGALRTTESAEAKTLGKLIDVKV